MQNHDRIESEKNKTLNKKSIKGNIVTIIEESAKLLLKTDGPF